VRPTLPVQDADRILRIQSLDGTTGDPDNRVLYDFQAWKDGLTSVELLGASVPLDRNLITDDGRSEPVGGVEISATAFRLFPDPPLLGRPLVAEDEQPAAPAVVVVGHSLWQARFNGDPGVVGTLMAVHVAGDATAFAPRLRAMAAAADPTLRLTDFKRLDQLNESDELAVAFFLRVTAVVSAVTLILATAGVYALSFNVTRRTREIGIRVAVGASARRILTGIFSRAFAQVGLGIVVGSVPGGILVALAAPEGFQGSGPFVATMAVITVAAFILGVTMLACFVPARRALRIHPTDALRADA
jgi:hypothetical protein